MNTPKPISPTQYRVLATLVTALERAGVRYQATGGLAGIVHGSRWPLHDIDLDVAAQDLPRVAKLFERNITLPLHRFIDDEFDLMLLRLELGGVLIDLSQPETAHGFTPEGARMPLPVDVARAQRKRFEGLELWAQPLADLIAYKRLIGREADVGELETLLGR